MRALALLDFLVAAPRGLGLTDVARIAGLNKTTAFRLLGALRHGGLVVQDPATGAYRPSLKIVRMAEQIVDALDFRTVARPTVEALARDLGLSVLAGIVEGGDVVYVDRAEGQETIQVYSRIGARRSVHLSAIGKAILAYMPPADVDAILALTDFAPNTEHTIVDRDTYLRHLEGVCQRGWAEARDEDALGFASVAAPVFDHNGRPAGALGVAASSFTLRGARQDDVVRRLVGASRRVSAELGYDTTDMQSGRRS